ncbi:HutD/Ves family protein [Dyella sp. 2RAB6]|uniref:HutD/Ves family protein n=1 Tax=Dyella sp. 2RAB6 TaxID=3232992 RepID=UPI003F9311A2
MSAFHRVPAETLRAEPWANGAGTTTVLASGPDPDAWHWRLSIAHLESDADFSALPGVRRQFTALDAPLALSFAGNERQALRLAVIRFDGADAPHARLTDGPTRAFNLMLRDGAEGELIARPLNGAMVLPPSADAHWFLYLLAGQAELRTSGESLRATQGESVWIEATGTLRIEGGGELVLARIEA